MGGYGVYVWTSFAVFALFLAWELDRKPYLIAPGSPWDLDHTEDRTGYLGPAHRSCNRSAGGRNGAALSLHERSAGRP